MKRLLLALLPVILLFSACSKKSGEIQYVELDEGIVAEVNGKTIPVSELDKITSRMIRGSSMNPHALNANFLKAARNNVLKNMIDRELMIQEAKDRGFSPTESEVDSTIRMSAARLGSEEELDRRLGLDGMTRADLRARLSEDNMVRSLIKKEVEEMLPAVTADDARAYYDGHMDEFTTPEKVRARHILFKVPDTSNAALWKAAEKKARPVLRKARAGRDFAALAKKHSEGPSAPKGGDLGAFTRRDMVKPFSDAAFALKVGGVSDLVRTRFGLHIIKVESKEESQGKTFEASRAQIVRRLKNQLSSNRYRDFVKELRAEAEIKISKAMEPPKPAEPAKSKPSAE